MMAILKLLLLAQIAGANEFPIGLYGFFLPQRVEVLVESGFTHIVPAGDEAAVANAATAKGIKVLGVLLSSAAHHGRSAPYDAAAWYIADEPEVNRQSPADMARIAHSVREWDPKTPLVLVVGDGSRAGEYSKDVDAVMVDWYPVPHLPLESTGNHVAKAVSQVGPKPVWAVIQAMDWRDYPQRDPKKNRIGRFPSLSEIRFMAYDSILSGASGVFFFEFQRRPQPGSCLLDFPERWQAVRRVAKELSFLSEFFSLSPGETVVAGELRAKRWRAKGFEIAIFSNPTRASTHIPGEFATSDWMRLFDYSLPPKAGPNGEALAPYGVRILSRRCAIL